MDNFPTGLAPHAEAAKVFHQACLDAKARLAKARGEWSAGFGRITPQDAQQRFSQEVSAALDAWTAALREQARQRTTPNQGAES